MDWATEAAAKIHATLEGGPYVADDVEKIASALRHERRKGMLVGLETAEKFLSVTRTHSHVIDMIKAAKMTVAD